MKLKRVLFGLTLIFIFVSCDCFVAVRGRVLSNITSLPIEGAVIEMVGHNIVGKTDKNGMFEISDQVGFCYDPHIKITAKGYKPFEVTIGFSGENKSFELKSKSEFVNYEKPFYPDTSTKSTYITGAWINQFSDHFTYCGELASGESMIFYLDTINPQKEILDNKVRRKEH
jgi:hypothetical protein